MQTSSSYVIPKPKSITDYFDFYHPIRKQCIAYEIKLDDCPFRKKTNFLNQIDNNQFTFSVQ